MCRDGRPATGIKSISQLELACGRRTKDESDSGLGSQPDAGQTERSHLPLLTVNTYLGRLWLKLELPAPLPPTPGSRDEEKGTIFGSRHDPFQRQIPYQVQYPHFARLFVLEPSYVLNSTALCVVVPQPVLILPFWHSRSAPSPHNLVRVIVADFAFQPGIPPPTSLRPGTAVIVCNTPDRPSDVNTSLAQLDISPDRDQLT